VRRGPRIKVEGATDYQWVPADWADPEWENATKVHDWLNHVPEHIQAIWPTFSDEQKKAIARWAEESASNEHWD
jgi:hypothetical protein